MSNAELAWLMCHLAYTVMAFSIDLAWFIRGNSSMRDIEEMQKKIDGVHTLLERFKKMSMKEDE